MLKNRDSTLESFPQSIIHIKTNFQTKYNAWLNFFFTTMQFFANNKSIFMNCIFVFRAGDIFSKHLLNLAILYTNRFISIYLFWILFYIQINYPT